MAMTKAHKIKLRKTLNQIEAKKDSFFVKDKVKFLADDKLWSVDTIGAIWIDDGVPTIELNKTEEIFQGKDIGLLKPV